MKTLYLNYKEFNLINKILINAGRQDLAYMLIRKSINNEDRVTIYDIDTDYFDLIMRLLIISDDVKANQIADMLIKEEKK